MQSAQWRFSRRPRSAPTRPAAAEAWSQKPFADRVETRAERVNGGRNRLKFVQGWSVGRRDDVAPEVGARRSAGTHGETQSDNQVTSASTKYPTNLHPNAVSIL